MDVQYIYVCGSNLLGKNDVYSSILLFWTINAQSKWIAGILLQLVHLKTPVL